MSSKCRTAFALASVVLAALPANAQADDTDAAKPLAARNVVGTTEDAHRRYAATTDGVFALTVETGRLAWRAAEGTHAFTPTPDTDGKRLWVGTRDGTLLVLAAETGEVLQQRSFPGWVYSPALIDDKAITGGRAATVWALDRASGEITWQRDLGQEMVGPAVALAGGAAAVATFDGRVRAFDAGNGTVRWSARLTPAPKALVAAGEHVLVLDFAGAITALTTAHGRRAWHYTPPYPAQGLRLRDQRLSAELETGETVLLDTQSGRRLPPRQNASEGSAAGPPRPAPDRPDANHS